MELISGPVDNPTSIACGRDCIVVGASPAATGWADPSEIARSVINPLKLCLSGIEIVSGNEPIN
jgi:hypothetical protein